MSTLAEPVPERLSADNVNARWAVGAERAAGLETRLVRQYEASLRATARRCVAAYRARTQVLVAAMPPKPEGDPTSISQPPQPTVDQVLNAELAEVSAEARTRTTRRRMAEAVAGEILGSFEPDEGTRALLEPLVRRQAGAQAERLVAGSRDAVANVILDALVEGWSVETTADYMLKVLNEQAKWRAVMLARTDLIALGNGAADAAVRVLGDAGPQYKTWLTAGDERVRETHVDANRQTVGAQQPFSVGNSLLQYPGDPAGGDEETINCRCTQIFTDSPQPVLRHTFAGGVDDRMAVTAAVFDESKHPRKAKGTPGGGRFRSLREVVENPSEIIEMVDEGEHEQLTRLAKEARAKGAEALKERKQTEDPQAVAHASMKHSGMLETARKLEEAAKHAKIQRSLTSAAVLASALSADELEALTNLGSGDPTAPAANLSA